ncbi:phosphopantothenate--cysteine ligase [Streptococcus azizii]|uniref:Phosphopantothenate--cysteine ligase n=1 Tax=Streptococcus azizii TaxID=1579424 RepID=A0AB36JPA0_9STRE|nr:MULTISPECIES: phosphopantothenate--cysteine ligase [Streptococcus]MBF0776140.1 phosphopantothenate--cysteine ligase [Streptococcus sp. 19428wD3_AN2]ONK26913.1 phosphopantothenate--cysteine ligase [Streptococcus azizii]ONK27935.1 phosphopantothenate--cysteine ligase [Streptococcus azizii]ONK28779.1 phosphopantothenate--cysteine ligase [Streptococcus azizii]TFU83485.1 phosphopantothenate--cysteine ligase [Streptococcus sp. AN2]
MKILITSGGTSEAIDRVRSITNHATGSLGKIMAEKCLAAQLEVTLVTTKTAIKPSYQDGLTIVEITDVASLIHTLEELVPLHDVMIHSMAVSDYSPVYMTGLEQVKMAPNLESLLDETNAEEKISSNDEYQVLFLKRTPKAISLIKQWNPDILLIGFKLLVNVSQDELFRVARDSLIKNQADYVLANDLTDIGPNRHKAYLLTQEQVYPAHTKEEIADIILEKIVKKRR